MSDLEPNKLSQSTVTFICYSASKRYGGQSSGLCNSNLSMSVIIFLGQKLRQLGTFT